VPPSGDDSFMLNDGSRVAVVGGGPAGSFFAHFLLLFAQRADTRIAVDIYEPRDFRATGSAGCNMCGGIVSESLVQTLAVEGISLPDTVVQRGLQAYVLHTDNGHCRIETPRAEKRIAAVHRGGGPRRAVPHQWESFDGHLLKLAIEQGANLCAGRVTAVRWDGDRPQVEMKGGQPQTYDLVVGALGINSPDLKLFEALGFGYVRPKPTKTFITELQFGMEGVHTCFGDAMHVFLLNIPRLQFAALIPKGEYVTMCLLGESIDGELVKRFFAHPQVAGCFPPGWASAADACRCSPKMFFGDAAQPFGNRVVLIGDAGVARLYKDGIGAAYRTAKAAARTAVFAGVSAEAFRRHYWPECRKLSRDNRFGRVVFWAVDIVKKFGFLTDALLHVTAAEQKSAGQRRLSMVLWDTFTGNARYQNVFLRSMHPSMLGRLAVGSVIAAGSYLGKVKLGTARRRGDR